MSNRGGVQFPFSAIVGQEALKTALLVNAVDSRVGGVLIRGQKGTAKSTAVRALAHVLPEVDIVDGCRLACDPYGPDTWCAECRVRSQAGALPQKKRRPPVVDLPVSATEDRLIGTLDIEHVLKKGERRFEPGLLADVNRGILYVDEVNLLDDHLVDTLLDVAAMGVNTVQREGIGLSHPSRFILVGTMNPEEGDLRPQLLDRFGLCVEIEGLSDPEDRVEIIRRRSAFDDDPSAFRSEWHKEEKRLEETIRKAQERLSDVVLSDEMLHGIASLCAELAVDGHRADLTLARAAIALAALQAHDEVTSGHVKAMAPFALTHRMRRKPFEQMSFDREIVQRVLSGSHEPDDGSPQDTSRDHPRLSSKTVQGERGLDRETAVGQDTEDTPTRLTTALDREKRAMAGRRQETRSTDRRGRFTRSEPAQEGKDPDIALAATVREAAVHQGHRSSEDGMAISVKREDVHNKVRTKKTRASILFCVDASGSMGANRRMRATRAAILDLLVDAYQRRDRVGLVSFRGDNAELVLSPTTSVELAQMKLDTLPTGGSTPLAHGLRKSLEVLEVELRRNSDTVPWLVLVTDGRANVGLNGGMGSEDARSWASKLRSSRIHTVVLDTDNGDSLITDARDLARLADGEYIRLAEITGTAVSRAVRDRLGSA